MHGKKKPRNEWDRKKNHHGGNRHNDYSNYSDDDCGGEWKRLERRQKGKNRNHGDSEFENESEY